MKNQLLPTCAKFCDPKPMRLKSSIDEVNIVFRDTYEELGLLDQIPPGLAVESEIWLAEEEIPGWYPNWLKNNSGDTDLSCGAIFVVTGILYNLRDHKATIFVREHGADS